MNILIVSTGQYPNQHAASVRHSAIASGLVVNGCNVEFLVLEKQSWNNKTLVYNNVLFTSMCKYQGNNKIFKKLFFKIDKLNLSTTIKKIHKTKSIDAVICFTIDISIIKKVQRVSKQLNLPVFHERTELPYVFSNTRTWIGKLKFKKYIYNLVPLFKGVFVISDKLENFFLQYNRNVYKILTVVDTAFFGKCEKSPFEFDYIAYCGTMSGTKDGVPILIEAFSKLSKNFPDINLVLIGGYNENDIADTLASIKRFKIEDKIIFTGFIDRDEMPKYLGNAKLLVVSKPDNEQNTGNFPIKVGEYLATGIPVVLTKVGEIPKFLKDGESAYLAKPDSSESFYEKMKEALLDYNKALYIGQNGKKLAVNLFDYKIQSKIMMDYIQKAISS